MLTLVRRTAIVSLKRPPCCAPDMIGSSSMHLQGRSARQHERFVSRRIQHVNHQYVFQKSSFRTAYIMSVSSGQVRFCFSASQHNKQSKAAFIQESLHLNQNQTTIYQNVCTNHTNHVCKNISQLFQLSC